MLRRLFSSFYVNTALGALGILSGTGVALATLGVAPADHRGWRSACVETGQTQERGKMSVFMPQGFVMEMESPFLTTKTICTRRAWTCPDGATCDPARRPSDADA